LNEKCKDCPYIHALDDRVDKLENTVVVVQRNLNIATTENEKTKIYYEKILDKIDDLKEIFSSKMYSFEERLGKVEKAVEEEKSNMFVKFSESPWSLKLLIYVLGGLAGLRLIGFDLSKILF